MWHLWLTPILWQPDAKNWLIGKDSDAGKDWRQEEKGTTEDEMAGWHHRLNGHEFDQAPGIGDGPGKPGVLQSMGSQRVGRDWVTNIQSVQFSHSVMSDSLQHHELQHSRPPCPSSTQGVYSNSSHWSVMPSDPLILCCPLLLLPSIFPSIRVFSNESVLCIRWPKYWSFRFNISPSNEYSGLISFRID